MATFNPLLKKGLKGLCFSTDKNIAGPIQYTASFEVLQPKLL